MDTLNDWFPTEEITVDCDSYNPKQPKTMPEPAAELKSLQLTPEITEALNLGLREMLFKGILEVDFIKVTDGSMRTMKCTLNERYTPEVDTSTRVKAARPFNPEIVPVYEVENDWRTFRVDSIVAVRKIEPLA
jgi:hypothetical protein